MKRIIEEYLLAWKDRANRKPLMIRGARQTGKTYTVEQFAKTSFNGMIKLNFDETPELKQIFTTNDIHLIKQNIELLTGTQIIPGSTLLFLDEIQQCPAAIGVLRYFYEKMPKLHVIVAGSLLDHALNDLNSSMPVGRIEFAYMHPLNFTEFLWANGEGPLADYLASYTLGTTINPVIHEKLLRLVRMYFFIGGMPEAVRDYATNADLVSVERIHESIIKSLEYDFAKYGTKGQQEILVAALRYIPTGLGKKLKYVNIDPTLRAESVKTALRLLEMSRIIHLVRHTNSRQSPLEQGNINRTVKPLFLDIGLVNHLLRHRLIDIDKLTSAHEGGLAEQFIGQQLLSSSPCFIDPQLYYWTREQKSASAELDFIVEVGGQIVPIEVKAGKTGTLKSLHVYIHEKQRTKAVRFNTDMPARTFVQVGIKTSEGPAISRYTLVSLPLYLAMEYQRLMDWDIPSD